MKENGQDDEDALKNAVAYIAKNFPQFSSVKSALYNAKATLVPPIPSTLEELVVNGSYGETELGARFLLKDKTYNDGGRMLIFASDSSLATLKKCKRWHVDGTFASAPKGFQQHYLIHGHYEGIFLIFEF